MSPAAMVGPVRLVGRKTVLEPLEQRHFEGLLAACTHDTEKYPFTLTPRSSAELEKWLAQALASVEAGTAVAFATCDARDGAVVGSTRFGNLERWDWSLVRSEGAEEPPLPATGGARSAEQLIDAVEIGWTWLSARAQRTGINTDAKLLMLTHAFEAWRVRRVTLKTDARNQRSRNAMLGIGARFDGVLRAHSPASDGGVRDSAYFSIVESEWSAVKAALAAKIAR